MPTSDGTAQPEPSPDSGPWQATPCINIRPRNNGQTNDRVRLSDHFRGAGRRRGLLASAEEVPARSTLFAVSADRPGEVAQDRGEQRILGRVGQRIEDPRWASDLVDHCNGSHVERATHPAVNATVTMEPAQSTKVSLFSR
jgi:hypothetical protein